MLVVSNFLLWIMVALLMVTVVALARQIAAMQERVASMRALVPDDGLQAGDIAPIVTGPTLDGRVLTIGGANSAGQAVLLLFIGPDCQTCKKIIPVAMIAARAEGLRLIFVGEGAAEDYLAMVRRYKMEGHDLLNSAQAGLAYQVNALPTGVLIRSEGTIAAKAAVNSREQLESLVVAKGLGVEAVRDEPEASRAEKRVVGIRAQGRSRP